MFLFRILMTILEFRSYQTKITLECYPHLLPNADNDIPEYDELYPKCRKEKAVRS